MFWLYLQFSHECFVISHLLSTGWWIHSVFNENKPHIRLSWYNRIVTELLSSESDCHTLWKGSTNWKMDRLSKIASANWTGRVSGECHGWQRRNWSCLLDLLLANSFYILSTHFLHLIDAWSSGFVSSLEYFPCIIHIPALQTVVQDVPDWVACLHTTTWLSTELW